MKLAEPLIKSVSANGREYRIDLDFRRVLSLMDIMARRDLLPEAKTYLALKQVIRKPPHDIRKCLELMSTVNRIIFNGQTNKRHDGQRVTDFEKDADYIKAAFLQAYGINLWRDKLHWQEFTALLAALPSGSKYMDILGIRAMPVPSPTKYNQKERENIIRAKAEFSLELSDEEVKRGYIKGVFAVADSLKAYAESMRGGNSV